MKKRKNVSLVLSGGGARGISHIGVINQLLNHGFVIKSISGTSIGALIGGMYAMGKLDDYSNWVTSLRKKDIWNLMDFTLSSKGLIKGNKIINKIISFIPDMDIEDMDIPFSAISTDIVSGKEVVFSSGSFYTAMRASISIPTIFTPLKYNDMILIDGGMINPIPIDRVKRSRNDILVAVNLYGDDIDNDSDVGYIDIMNISTILLTKKIIEQSLLLNKPDILINIPYKSSGLFDFHKSSKLIDLGERISSRIFSEYLK